MKRITFRSLPEESIQDRAYDLLGEMILQKEAETIMKELRQEYADGKTSAMDAFYARNDPILLQKINHVYKQARKHSAIGRNSIPNCLIFQHSISRARLLTTW